MGDVGAVVSAGTWDVLGIAEREQVGVDVSQQLVVDKVLHIYYFIIIKFPCKFSLISFIVLFNNDCDF